MAIASINLHEAIYSLSDALDLVGVTHIHHGKRVAYMATECGKRLGWSKSRLDDLFAAAILHDCGVSKTAVHAKLAQLQWEEEGEHCRVGADLMASATLLRHFAPIVRYHHTHWSQLASLDLPLDVKLDANAIYLADRVDILALKYLAEGADILTGVAEIRETIAARRGDWFCPELVEAFLEVSRSEAFWFSLETHHVDGYAATWLTEITSQAMSFNQLVGLVRLFSRIVDAKSSFTKEHSDGVASLARYLGSLCGLPAETCDLLELAGLLHDIGKLRVPDELLEKPARLTDAERITMRRHSFDTYAILKTISGLEQVTQWAAQHHERMDGAGYPYHLGQSHLALEARIIQVADVFQALAQHRPYRDSLPPDQILAILQDEAANGALDAAVVAQVAAHLPDCWRAALPAAG
jgi:HD-GYP domain-containing protein (c-di-GMP phosphodiesterase class II)